MPPVYSLSYCARILNHKVTPTHMLAWVYISSSDWFPANTRLGLCSLKMGFWMQEQTRVELGTQERWL